MVFIGGLHEEESRRIKVEHPKWGQQYAENPVLEEVLRNNYLLKGKCYNIFEVQNYEKFAARFSIGFLLWC